MIRKLTALAVLAAFSATGAFANDMACCAGAKTAANKGKMQCVSFASLKVNAEQKSKLEGWQADCMKAGCTKEAHAKFLKEAKGILSAEQYAKLQKQCGYAGAKTQS